MRDDGASRSRGRVQDAVGHQWRRLQICFRPRTDAFGLETPGDFELIEIDSVDLIDRRVVGVCKVCAVTTLLDVFRPGLSGDSQKHQHQQKSRGYRRGVRASPAPNRLYSHFFMPGSGRGDRLV